MPECDHSEWEGLKNIIRGKLESCYGNDVLAFELMNAFEYYLNTAKILGPDHD